MLNYKEELGELKDIVIEAARWFKGKTQLYNWENSWRGVGETMDMMMEKQGYSPDVSRAPDALHPLASHFKAVYQNCLNSLPPVPDCHTHLTDMLTTLRALEDMQKVLPFPSINDQTMHALGATAKTQTYASASTLSEAAFKQMQALDADTTAKMNKIRGGYTPLSEKEWLQHYYAALDDRKFLLHRKSNAQSRTEETMTFHLTRNQKPNDQMNSGYPEHWNVLACGANEKFQGTTLLLVQSILEPLRTSSQKCLSWSVGKSH